MSPQAIRIRYRDGTSNQFSYFPGENPEAPVVLCLPALGVRASYYQPLGAELTQQGFHSYTLDWRGLGHSNVRPSRTLDFGYKELIADLTEALELIRQSHPKIPIYLLGHSLGGQIGSLYSAKNPGKLAGIVLITSCTVYYQGWEGQGAWKVRLAGQLFYPLSKLIGHFPGNLLGFGGKEARSVMRDWCQNALSGKYIISKSNFDYEAALKKTTHPVLAISLEGDWMASKQAVINLYKKFHDEAPITHLHESESSSAVANLNHFNWVKQPSYFVSKIKSWTENPSNGG